MADETVTIRLELEKSDLKNISNQTNQTFKKAGDKAGNSFGESFSAASSKIIKAGAVALAAAAASTVLVFRKGIEAAKVQEDAINSLNSALIASGKFSLEASTRLQEYASGLQQVTRFGDEAILQTQALLQSLGGLSEQGLKDATQATLDLATALRIDLNSAAVLVGKAAAGEVGSFSRYGIIVKKGADNAETFAKALTAINAKFGGAAARDVNTYSGATQQLSNVIGDAFEEIGFLITKNAAVIKIVKEATTAFANYASNIKNGAGLVTQAIDSGLTVFGTAIVIVDQLGRAFTILSNIVQIAGKSLVNGFLAPLALIEQGIDSLIKRFPSIGEKLGQASTTFREAFSNMSDSINQDNLEINEALTGETGLGVFAQKIADIQFMLQNATKASDEFTGKVVSNNQVVEESNQSFFESFSQGFQSMEEKTKKLSNVIVAFGKTAKNALVNGVGQGFAAVGRALVEGSNALDAFLAAFLGQIGQAMIAQGTQFILTGIGYQFLPGFQGIGAGLIGAGSALAVAGGALSAVAGSISKPSTSGVGGAVGTTEATTLPNAEDVTEQEARPPSVTVNVQGDVLDSEETGLRIVDLINKSVDDSSVSIRRGAFA